MSHADSGYQPVDTDDRSARAEEGERPSPGDFIVPKRHLKDQEKSQKKQLHATTTTTNLFEHHDSGTGPKKASKSASNPPIVPPLATAPPPSTSLPTAPAPALVLEEFEIPAAVRGTGAGFLFPASHRYDDVDSSPGVATLDPVEEARRVSEKKAKLKEKKARQKERKQQEARAKEQSRLAAKEALERRLAEEQIAREEQARILRERKQAGGEENQGQETTVNPVGVKKRGGTSSSDKIQVPKPPSHVIASGAKGKQPKSTRSDRLKVAAVVFILGMTFVGGVLALLRRPALAM